MKFYTKTGSFFEVRKVHTEQYRIFYCWETDYSRDEKWREKLVSSQENHKKANKMAKHFREFYDLGYSDGLDW